MNHADRCAEIARLIRTEEGARRLAELFANGHKPCNEERASAIRETVIALRGQGYGYERIGRAVGCHWRFVRSILRAAGEITRDS